MRMREGVLTTIVPAIREIYGLGRRCTRTDGGKNSVQSSLENPSSAEHPEIKLEKLAERIQRRTQHRALVRWVAGMRASAHTKLLAAFLIVPLPYLAMAPVRLRTVVRS